MKTTFLRPRCSPDERRTLAMCTACETISAAESCLRYPICPVAQKTHPIAQPAWLLRQAVVRPVKRMSTVSILSPSASERRYLRVNPSLESVSRETGRLPMRAPEERRERTRAGRSPSSGTEPARPR
jgi:hypothetical protein